MPITIAIDGYSSCGKSTLAKDVAANLGYIYVDSGAMYRAVTLKFLQDNTDVYNEPAVALTLSKLNLRFRSEGTRQRVLLDGKVVEDELRSMAVNDLVSPVATLSAVRKALVAQQQAIGAQGGIVMDGRDIGTVVFPSAELKFFVTAAMPIRVERRYAELAAKGKTVDRELVEQNLRDRDHIDSTREDSPLRQASDAIVIDNSMLSREEQAAAATAIAKARVQHLGLAL